jgi:hypothetical protein
LPVPTWRCHLNVVAAPAGVSGIIAIRTTPDRPADCNTVRPGSLSPDLVSNLAESSPKARIAVLGCHLSRNGHEKSVALALQATRTPLG